VSFCGYFSMYKIPPYPVKNHQQQRKKKKKRCYIFFFFFFFWPGPQPEGFILFRLRKILRSLGDSTIYHQMINEPTQFLSSIVRSSEPSRELCFNFFPFMDHSTYSVQSIRHLSSPSPSSEWPKYLIKN